MNPRIVLPLSLGLNFALAALVVATVMHRPPRPPAPKPAIDLPGPPPSAPVATNPTLPAASPPSRPRFHWAQVESDDYRQYLANLRALGCPAHVIRDLLVEDVTSLYDRRRAAIPRSPLPPWAGADARATAAAEQARRREALDAEQRAVLIELLGFPWEWQAIQTWRNEPVAWALLGFLTDDQATRMLGLVEMLTDDARRYREEVDGILLAEDRVALAGLADRFDTDLAAFLTPQQAEELTLRVQALGMAFGKGDLHLGAADLTDLQARDLVRLSLRAGHFLRTELVGLEPPADERALRQAQLEADAAALLGPQPYAEFARAQDPRFRDVLDFAQEQGLTRKVAIAAFEIRQLAEAERAHLTALTAENPQFRQAQLEQLQQTAATALAALLDAPSLRVYLERDHGEWLNTLGAEAAPATPTSTP
jgi:hypothetical protein